MVALPLATSLSFRLSQSMPAFHVAFKIGRVVSITRQSSSRVPILDAKVFSQFQNGPTDHVRLSVSILFNEMDPHIYRLDRRYMKRQSDLLLETRTPNMRMRTETSLYVCTNRVAATLAHHKTETLFVHLGTSWMISTFLLCFRTFEARCNGVIK